MGLSVVVGLGINSYISISHYTENNYSSDLHFQTYITDISVVSEDGDYYAVYTLGGPYQIDYVANNCSVEIYLTGETTPFATDLINFNANNTTFKTKLGTQAYTAEDLTIRIGGKELSEEQRDEELKHYKSEKLTYQAVLCAICVLCAAELVLILDTIIKRHKD